MIGYILLLTGKRAYKWGTRGGGGRLICGSLQYDVFVGRANAFACESAMLKPGDGLLLKLKREVEMGRVKAAWEGAGRALFASVRSFPKEQRYRAGVFFLLFPPTFPSFTLAPTLRVAISSLPNLPLA